MTDDRLRPGAATLDARLRTVRAVMLGVLAALLAIALRLLLRAEVGGQQAIFSYPAIAIATLLFGTRAGAATAIVCFLALWYFVLSGGHSFAVPSAAAAITLAVYVVVGSSLVWAIGSMRAALAQYRRINDRLEHLVDRRTAERNRLWERSRELMAIVDGGDRVRAANPALRRTLGLDDPLLAPPAFADLLLSEDRRAYRDARERGAESFEARVAGPAGAASVSWSMVPDGGLRYLVGRDVTAEREYGELLRHSQKMEFIGQMAGGLAHDFGNLLPPISMTLHLLEKRHGEDARTRELIEAAEESVERADKLIKRLLDLSRPGRTEPAVRAVGPLLDEVAPLLRQVLGTRELRLSVDPGTPDIAVDADQLHMALLNLAINARDATEEGAVVELGAAPAEGARVRITLADQGRGMDAETLARAVEPFYSTKASGEGTGLGLPMVHNFAVAAGGDLRIESAVGAGTRVTMTLPAV